MPDAIQVFNLQKFSLHDGPGIRTVVFFSGCPIRCRWCANPESQAMGFVTDLQGIASARAMAIPDILNEVLKDKPFYDGSGGGVTLSGGEPLMQPDGAQALLQAARQAGVHCAMETSCFAPPEVFERMLPLLDYALPDLKHHSSDQHLQGTGAPLEPILTNLRALIESKLPHVVRIPVIPGFNDALDDAHRFRDLLCGMGASHVELLPFHQFGERKHALLGREYAYEGVPAMRPEALLDYAATLRQSGLRVDSE